MNSRKTDTLELLSELPERARAGMPPLLFVHGAYAGAWCWQEHFLPWFAAAGFRSYALSLSGHAGSRGRKPLDSCSIDDYVNDVVEAIATLPEPPVLIGHSMGGFVVQKYLEKHDAPAAVLMCSVPPQGLASSAVSMFFGKPGLLVDLNRLMSGGQVALDSLREALFAQPVAMDDLLRYYRLSQPESHRAIWDMMLFNLPHTARVLAHLPRGRDDLRVVGAAHDLIIPASLVEMTAHSYGVTATLHPAMGHGLMLEADWQEPARDIADWLAERFG
ncbi:MAG: alpha/beta hydrolase [Rhodocyclaceae bacterium]|jgi:non-heme chloroperoxidase|nr:alpha/beta hydrolase [Rhodocyclaceae bacterium]